MRKFFEKNAYEIKSRKIFFAFFSLIIFLVSGRALAANLILSPSVGTYNVGDTFKVSILVDTQGVSINSIDTDIKYPSDLLDVVSVNKSGSILSMWIQEPTNTASNGSITFTGGLPTPGFTGASGKVLDITFKAKSAGVAKLSFLTSSVRANDGLGTDVLQSAGEEAPDVPAQPPALSAFMTMIAGTR